MDENYIWKINDCEFELDMEDAETAENYISAIRVLENSRTQEVTDIAEKIRKYCKAFREFYDALLGEGASAKIFDGIKDNARKYDAVYESLLEFIANQKAVSSERMNEITRRYAPKRVKRND